MPCVLLLALYFQGSHGDIVTFENAQVKQPEYLEVPKYAPSDVPHWAPGRGKSYIDLSAISVAQDCGSTCTPISFLDIIIFEDTSSVSSWMEHWGPEKQFCCSKDMAERKECPASEIGSLHVPYSLHGVYKMRVNVTSTSPVLLAHTNAITHLDIQRTGLYIIVLAVCATDSSPVVLNGVIDSLDPYGYLPADEFGDLPFYGSLALAHTLIAVIWAAICFFYMKDLMFLQLWISIVLAMGMIETTMFFAYYLDWNDSGAYSLGLLTVALVMGVVKRMISRLLVLVISLGYGVVRPSLGDDLRKVVFLGIAYFVLSLVYTLTTSFPDSDQRKAVDEDTMDLMAVVIIMMMAVEAIFYFWIFKSLGSLMDSLAAKRQAAKYQLYRGFQGALIFSLLLTCGLGLFTIVETTMGSPDKEWEDNWLNDGYWELAYFVVFTAIAFFFAPSNNNQRYAYSAQLNTSDEDETEQLTNVDSAEAEVDAEYGGKLDDGDDPFAGGGALDPKQAVLKKA